MEQQVVSCEVHWKSKLLVVICWVPVVVMGRLRTRMKMMMLVIVELWRCCWSLTELANFWQKMVSVAVVWYPTMEEEEWRGRKRRRTKMSSHTCGTRNVGRRKEEEENRRRRDSRVFLSTKLILFSMQLYSGQILTVVLRRRQQKSLAYPTRSPWHYQWHFESSFATRKHATHSCKQ